MTITNAKPLGFVADTAEELLAFVPPDWIGGQRPVLGYVLATDATYQYDGTTWSVLGSGGTPGSGPSHCVVAGMPAEIVADFEGSGEGYLEFGTVTGDDLVHVGVDPTEVVFDEAGDFQLSLYATATGATLTSANFTVELTGMDDSPQFGPTTVFKALAPADPIIYSFPLFVAGMAEGGSLKVLARTGSDPDVIVTVTCERLAVLKLS